MMEFSNVEFDFCRFDAKFKDARADLLKSDLLTLEKIELIVRDNLNSAREILINKTKNHQIKCLKSLNTKMAQFVGSNFDLEKTMAKFLINKIIQNENFMKFKYLSPDIGPSNMYQKSDNDYSKKSIFKLTRLHLSDCLIMSFIEATKNCKTIKIKIENTKTSRDIYSSQLRLKYDQSYQVLSYGVFIVVLVFNDFVSNFNLLCFDQFSNELVLFRQKTIAARLNLHSMNRNEIICMQVNRAAVDKYVVFDYEFVKTAQFGQNLDPKEAFFIRDCSLIGVSFDRIYLYFYDICAQKHRVKILNRTSGTIEKLIDVVDSSTKFGCIKLDSSFRLMIRSPSKNEILYYNCNGDFLFSIKHNLFLRNLKNFDQISDNIIKFSHSNEYSSFITFL